MKFKEWAGKYAIPYKEYRVDERPDGIKKIVLSQDSTKTDYYVFPLPSNFSKLIANGMIRELYSLEDAFVSGFIGGSYWVGVNRMKKVEEELVDKR